MADSSNQGVQSNAFGTNEESSTSTDITNAQHEEGSVGSSSNAANGAGINSFGISNSNGADVTFNQESPQAIAALLTGTQTALETVGSVASSATGLAKQVAQEGSDLASANSGTAANQITKLLWAVGIVAILITAIVFYKRRG